MEIQRKNLKKKRNILKKTFGIIRFKRDTKKILRKIDKDSWDE